MYHLVHILVNEHKSPLIASMVFDRAEVQATMPGNGRPASVSVWIITSMRGSLEKEILEIARKMKARCPNLKIHVIGGINRLKNWPAVPKIRLLRMGLKGRVVYHCRGEWSVQWAEKIRKLYPNDRTLLDVRGYYPLERFINHPTVKSESDMTPGEQALYRKDIKFLQSAIDHSDAMCTVSEPLKEYLVKNLQAEPQMPVVPCCVKNIVPDDRREQVRKLLQIENKTAILYLGGVHKNQFLEELVIPFVKSAVCQSPKYVGVFMTQHKDKMRVLLDQFELNSDQIRLISVAQDEVAGYLTGMDLGLLLREPSIQNTFSQPVKFGEYLSAGIPVVVEDGTGEIPDIVAKHNIGYTVRLTDKKGTKSFDEEVKKALDWFEKNDQHTLRNNARQFVTNCYTWEANAPVERQMYQRILEMRNRNVVA
jgi:glycosyltransferase involved in cell wall biosynthesis